jgi:hypothetical protein
MCNGQGAAPELENRRDALHYRKNRREPPQKHTAQNEDTVKKTANFKACKDLNRVKN